MKDRRLLRININILIITVVLALATLPAKSENFGIIGVLIGGGLSFTYFLLLSITVSRAFTGIGEEGLEPKAAGRLGLKLLLYTFGLALFTIIAILSKLCQPVAFLTGFSALLISIGFAALNYAAFGKPHNQSEDPPGT
jgi:hypothetical protein